MNTNFVEKMNELIKEIHEMNEYCVNELGDNYAECFPAMGIKKVEIDGKKYAVNIEITIREL